jgi:uncharacterized protein YigE (DUF2233 family)
MSREATFFAVVAGSTLFIAAEWRIGAKLYANSSKERRREGVRVARIGSRIWFAIGITTTVIALILLLLSLVS